MWHVYILECADGRLYTGITTDIERRMKEHEKGKSKGARFTRMFGFKKLLYQTEFPSRVDAMRRENEIKRWPKSKKLALIDGEIE